MQYHLELGCIGGRAFFGYLFTYWHHAGKKMFVVFGA
jgi:hypothetical protein